MPEVVPGPGFVIRVVLFALVAARVQFDPGGGSACAGLTACVRSPPRPSGSRIRAGLIGNRFMLPVNDNGTFSEEYLSLTTFRMDFCFKSTG